jgi:hypothetical protein
VHFLSVSAHLFVPCRVNSQVQLSVGKPDLPFPTANWSNGQQPTLSSGAHSTSAGASLPAHTTGPEPGANSAGNDTGTGHSRSNREEVHLVCSQELSSTILQFLAQPRVGPPHLSLQQQHHSQEAPVFYIASPGKVRASHAGSHAFHAISHAFHAGSHASHAVSPSRAISHATSPAQARYEHPMLDLFVRAAHHQCRVLICAEGKQGFNAGMQLSPIVTLTLTF